MENSQIDNEIRGDFIVKTTALVTAAVASGIDIEETSALQQTETIFEQCSGVKLEIDPNLSKEQQEYQRVLLRAYSAMDNLDSQQAFEIQPDIMINGQVKSINETFSDIIQYKDISTSFEKALWMRDDVRHFILKQLAGILKIVTIETEKPGIHEGSIQSASSTGLQDLNSIKRFEPRINYIAQQLHNILEFLRFYINDEELAVTSFRLNNLRDWLIKTDMDRSVAEPYTSVLQYLSWGCRMACRFCLHQNDPDRYWTKSTNWKTSRKEVMTRLKYFDPQNGTALFRTQDYNYYEILTHPDFIEIVRQVRKKTEKVISFATNGVTLTEEFIQKLSEFKPFHFMLSLNSANPIIRKEVMRDTNPEIAINSLSLLKKYKIPYSVSIVPMHDYQLDDLVKTILYANQNDAYLIRVNLDAYSRHFSGDDKDALQERGILHWKRIIQTVRSIRPKIATPIVFQPSMLEENIYGEYDTGAFINGVIKNSPAARSGLQHGDRIVQIDNFIVNSKTLIANILRAYQMCGVEHFIIQAKRRDEILSFSIKENFCPPEDNTNYPHFPYLYKGKDGPTSIYAYGILLQSSLNTKYLWDIESIITKHQARNVLFLSSFLVEPTLSELVKHKGFLRENDVNFRIGIPENRHFLGGNIIIGDLLVVDDFIERIKKEKKEIDLVIIPSTPFGSWGRDISGRVFKEIERIIDIPVELLKSEIISVI